MPSRVEAESIIRALTGGASPEDLDSIVFTKEYGWTFGTSAVGSVTIYDPSWYLVASIDTGTPEAFGYRFLIDPSDFLSINVTYNPGAGAETYNYDISAVELHTLFLTDGVTPFTTDETQTGFDITITPYDAAGGSGGSGTPGTAITLKTGDVLRAGIGMLVENLAATALAANLIRPTAPFEFARDAADSELLLQLSPTYNAGTLGATWAPNYDNGPSQRATAGQALQVNDITNFPDGGTMNIHIAKGAYDITFNSTFFEGPTTIFTTDTNLAVSVLDLGLSKLVISGVTY